MNSGGGTVSGMRIFGIVWVGQLVSIIGSSLTGFGLGVWVYQGTSSVTQFAFITVCVALPGILTELCAPNALTQNSGSREYLTLCMWKLPLSAG